MSRRTGAAGGGSTRAAKGQAPATRPLVAVLERRGRFLTAQRLFPADAPGAGGGERGSSSAIVLKPTHSGRGGKSEARAGDLVLVQAGGRGSAAHILKVLGRPDIARDLIEGLMLDRGLHRRFAPEVEREARAAGERVAHAPGDRRDLRALATFTVDPARARDFDDAISAEAASDGRTRVWVHIADVAAHVPEGSAVDREARRRATSVYVPGAVEPMLPHALSSEACSLVPGRERAAVTVELEMHGASIERAAFYRSLIRSDARLDYEQVDRVFAGSEPAAEPWGTPLAVARAVAAALQRKREQSGALAVDSAEPEFSFDERGDVTQASARAQTESHRLVEHLMIAANEAVAGLLSKRGVPCLYRVHERPEPERIERLADQLASLEVPTPPLPEQMSPAQAAELIGPISARVVEHVRGTGRGRFALYSLVLRSLKQAYYSPKNLGHTGLRSLSYCHFTSPIRRYPDLVCHRALLSAVGGGERAPRAGELVELGAWTSEREREAMKIERGADDVASCFALERVLHEGGFDQVFAGEIAGLISAGAFIAFTPADAADAGGDTIAARFEGMLPVRLMRAPAPAATDGGGEARTRGARKGAPRDRESAREWWELNAEGTILRGERTGASLRLGDPIEVRVERVDTVRGRVDLLPTG